MLLNKHALIRYRIINELLISLKYVTLDELISSCEERLSIKPIGERTIKQDIHDMRYDSRLAYFAPICYDKYKKRYYYSDPNFSIDNSSDNNEIVIELLDKINNNLTELLNKVSNIYGIS